MKQGKMRFKTEKKLYRKMRFGTALFITLLSIFMFVLVKTTHFTPPNPAILFSVILLILTYAISIMWTFKNSQPVIITTRYIIIADTKLPLSKIDRIVKNDYWNRIDVCFKSKGKIKRISGMPHLFPKIKEFEELLSFTDIRFIYGISGSDKSRGLLYKSGLRDNQLKVVIFLFPLMLIPFFMSFKGIIYPPEDLPVSVFYLLTSVISLLPLMMGFSIIKYKNRQDLEIYRDRLLFSDDTNKFFQYRYKIIEVHVKDIDYYDEDTTFVLKDGTEHNMPIMEYIHRMEIIEKIIKDIGIRINNEPDDVPGVDTE